MNTDNTTAEFPSTAKLQEWKNKHKAKELTVIEVDEFQMILRPFKLVDLERAQTADPKGDKPYNFHRSIINNCRLWETPGMMDDDDRAMALFGKIDELNVKKEATLKKI